MNKWIVVLIVAFLLVGLAVPIYYLFNQDKFNQKIETTITNSTTSPTIAINYTNFAKEIAKNSLIQALPDKSIISLRFYNFDNGQRNYEKSFVLTRASVKEENTTSADITLLLHSKYLKGLTNKNFCDIIQKANTAGDLGVETNLSMASLALKFRSVIKYKSCIGL